MPVSSIGELRERRRALGVSLGELAEAIGRSPSTLSRIERGQIRPSFDLVQLLGRFLDEREKNVRPPLTARDLMRPGPVTVEAATPVAEAASAMEAGGFSQLPVVDGGRVTGSLSETALLRVLADPRRRRLRAGDVQEAAYPQVDPGFPADLLSGILVRYPAVLVVERGRLAGIVTKADLIRGLWRVPLPRRGSAARAGESPDGPAAPS